MYELLAELFVEFGIPILYSLGATLLTVVGAAAEYNSLQNYSAGHGITAVWFAYIGVVALLAAVDLAREVQFSNPQA